MFGNNNNGAGPRSRYYTRLVAARDAGRAWNGTVKPAPDAATCANGRARQMLLATSFVHAHRSPGRITW
jgi:hypothetical protein